MMNLSQLPTNGNRIDMLKVKTIVDLVAGEEFYAILTLHLACDCINDAVKDYGKYNYQIVVIATPKPKKAG